ncbi:hypothetical protein KA005_30105, partial [bacterium]|nr:hypothetical protein [bacterium]
PLSNLLISTHLTVDYEFKIKIVHALEEMGDLRVISNVIDWLFLRPPGKLFARKSLIKLGHNLFGDYANIISKAAGYLYKGPARDMDMVYYEISIEEDTDIVDELSIVKTGISTNLLHKVSLKKDINIYQRDGIDCTILSFNKQRLAAKNEILQRGSPPYDPSLYLKREAWKIEKS